MADLVDDIRLGDNPDNRSVRITHRDEIHAGT
jgi:hypothetical protein